MYSKELAERVREYLSGNEWEYEFNDETGVFWLGMRLRHKISKCDVTIRVRNVDIISYTTMNLNADDDVLSKVSTYMALLNSTLAIGNYQIDYDDRTITYRVQLACDGIIPTDGMLGNLVGIPCDMIEKDGDGLLKVLLGGVSPMDAFMEVMAKREEEETEEAESDSEGSEEQILREVSPSHGTIC